MQRSPHLPRLLDQLSILGKKDSNLVAPCISHKINSTAHSVTYSPVSREMKLARMGYQGNVEGEIRGKREQGGEQERGKETERGSKG